MPGQRPFVWNAAKGRDLIDSLYCGYPIGYLLAGRLLPFDRKAARRAVGLPVHRADCQMAALARSRNAGLATRNVKDFDGCEIDVINPWRTS